MFYKAHPTKYAGAMFRSRLEARWAAFFDLAGWRWDYEPVDYAGWVPDFLLHPEVGDPIPVEVKPIEWPADADACAALVRVREDLAKVRAYKAREVLLLGAYPPPVATGRALTPIGWQETGSVLGVLWDGFEGDADPAILYRGSRGRRFDFAAMYGLYFYRLGGDHDGDAHLESLMAFIVTKAWRDAGNRVQWRAPTV